MMAMTAKRMRFLLAAAPVWLAPLTAASAAPDAERARELIHLVRQDCGSCHGMTFRGGLGPPLLPETLRDKPRESLIAAVLHGRPGTPMPPWLILLNESEAAWIVDRLVEGFPEGK
jgi:cytochrome c55X